jgi:hypothetical protein
MRFRNQTIPELTLLGTTTAATLFGYGWRRETETGPRTRTR